MTRILCAVLAIVATAYVVQVRRAHGRTQVAPDEGRLVPVASTDQVLDLIRQGKRVLFVDAREPREWQEEHIPGAINVSLREVAQLDKHVLGNPDLVVAYCLKDFRGFEVAKALHNAGVGNSLNLAEFGINGWKKQGLPTVALGMRTEQQAADLLAQCARDRSRCTQKAR
jgi:rhodanese-related sulfurtransferase